MGDPATNRAVAGANLTHGSDSTATHLDRTFARAAAIRNATECFAGKVVGRC